MIRDTNQKEMMGAPVHSLLQSFQVYQLPDHQPTELGGFRESFEVQEVTPEVLTALDGD